MYIDANIFIFAQINTGREGEFARTILERISRGEQAITSTLTMDEVLWVLRRYEVEDMRGILEDIYGLSGLKIVSVDPLVPLKALEFIERYDLKPRDSFHLAVMESHGTKNIVSTDVDFDRVEGINRTGVEL